MPAGYHCARDADLWGVRSVVLPPAAGDMRGQACDHLTCLEGDAFGDGLYCGIGSAVSPDGVAEDLAAG